jgi:hypothetical protein
VSTGASIVVVQRTGLAWAAQGIQPHQQATSSQVRGDNGIPRWRRRLGGDAGQSGTMA